MGDLTKNLSLHEFSCHCTYEDCPSKLVADFKLVHMIQDCVDHFAELHNTKAIVSITSPNRCFKHNKDEGGAPNSFHVKNIAADFKIKVWLGESWHAIEAVDMAKYLDAKYPDSHGIGIYSNRVHADVRSYKARWPREVWNNL